MSDTPQPTFAQVLERLMAARGLSQAKLAEALGVYDGNVRRWRMGKGIEIENAWKIADYFGVDRTDMARLAGYGDNPLSLTEEGVSPEMAALYDAERASLASDLSGIPTPFHTAILATQQAARRLAIELATAAIKLAEPAPISLPKNDELAPPGNRRKRSRRREDDPGNSPLAACLQFAGVG